MGAFSGIKDAQQMGGGRRLEVGNYELEIDTVRFFTSRKDGSSPIFAVDFKVTESDNPAFKKNDRIGWMTQKGKFKDYFLADIKSFIAAVMNVKDDIIGEEEAEEVVSEDQPLRGRKVRCNVVPGKKRNPETNEFYTKYIFAPAAA